MKSLRYLLPLIALTAPAAAQEDAPRTYLASIVDLPLGRDESLESFSFDTWGVEFVAVCKIPSGWRIRAGSSATPSGTLEGNGSQGATWFSEASPSGLREIVLIKLSAAIQEVDVTNGPPATFKGEATISTEEGERVAQLNQANILLTPASRCP